MVKRNSLARWSKRVTLGHAKKFPTCMDFKTSLTHYHRLEGKCIMENISVLDIIMRWLHLIGAIVAIGGSIFALFVLLPSISGLAEDIRSEIYESVRSRFSKLFMFAIAALLISGFYNYLGNEMSNHEGQSAYHILMGIKIMLAMGVFFLGSALLGRSAAFEGIRRKRRRWMVRNILLALLIIAIAAVLAKMPDG